MAKYKIGYIDEKEDEVKMFRRILRDFDIEVIGYEFKEGMTKEQLLLQVYSSDIDLLLIDYKLKGTLVTFNGEEIENEIYDKRPLFPYIIFTSDKGQAERFVEDWKTIFDKEELSDNNESRKKRFVTIIEKSIEQYRNHIAKKKEQLSELLIKGESEQLNVIEKDKIIKLQRELQQFDKTQEYRVPEQLLKPDVIALNDDLKKEADELLNQLLEIKKKNER